jgi:hypothetical protein
VEVRLLSIILLTYAYFRWFERFIMLMIFLNSVALSIFDYSDRNSDSTYNKIIDYCGYGFTVIFSVECILKIIGMGFA